MCWGTTGKAEENAFAAATPLDVALGDSASPGRERCERGCREGLPGRLLARPGILATLSSAESFHLGRIFLLFSRTWPAPPT